MGASACAWIPENLIHALHARGTKDLTVISNNAGVDDFGVGILLRARQVKKMISTYVGENKEFERQFLSGELEVELVPQGTFSERMRAAGAGIGGFFTPTAYGTHRRPRARRRGSSTARAMCSRRRSAPISRSCKAWKGDRLGNLVYRRTARNFNPVMATAGDASPSPKSNSSSSRARSIPITSSRPASS